MLGLGLASEYAGWWTGRVPVLRDSVTVTSSIPQRFMVSPRYYANMTGSTNNTWASPMFLAASGATLSLDMTGAVNQPKRSVSAITFKIGTNWMTTAPTTGYYNGILLYDVMNNNGTDNYYSVGIVKNNNTYLLSPSTQFQGISLTPTQLDSYRNRWLTLICATSDSTSTFANWTGTGTNTYNWASRMVLYDVENNTVLRTSDQYAYAAVGTVDLTQTWTLGYLTSSYYLNHFVFYDNPSLYYRYDSNVASTWYAIGETFDPSVYYSQLAGSGVGSTVNGVRAWTVFGSNGAGTASGDTRTQLIGTWGNTRMPSANAILLRGGSSETLPVYTSF